MTEKEYKRSLRKRYLKEHSFDLTLRAVMFAVLVAVLVYVCRDFIGRGLFVAAIYAIVTVGNEYKNYRHNFFDPEMEKFLEEHREDME